MTVEHPDDEGARADVVLGRRAPGLSRRAARAMALEGHLRIDGRAAPPSRRVGRGSVLELSWTAATPAPPRILRVTDDFVYVDKPAGVHTHRLRPDDPPALADMVVAVHPECGSASRERREQGALHRLDRGTTGVVAFARNRAAWTAAHDALRTGRAVKLYLAICQPTGRPGHHHPLDLPLPEMPPALHGCQPDHALRIEAPIGRGSARGRLRVREDGLPARTEVWTLARGRTSDGLPRVLCLVRLHTGRRHQARVHLAHIGLPIVGDPIYAPCDVDAGTRRDPTGRPLLHALRLDLRAARPTEGPVDATLPPDLSAAITDAGLDAHLPPPD